MRPKSKFGYVNHDLWAVMDRARKQVPMSALGLCAARDHPHASNSLAQLGYEVNAVLNRPRF